MTVESVPVFSVTNLWEMIEATLEPLMTSRFRLRGTLQDVAVRKHLYCSMTDQIVGAGSAKVNAVIFATDFARIRAELAHRGLGELNKDVEIVAIGRLSTYRPGGRVSFVIEQLDYEEMRRLSREDLERLRAALMEEGVFDANRRLTLCAVPLDIAIVTSQAGTVQHDFTRVLQRSGFAFAWKLYSTPVTGMQAGEELAAMIRRADEGSHDLIVVLRGGGSESELAVFNAEPVVRAVVASATPIWCAIGHAADEVLLNEVAHRALDVPQSVAVALVERVGEFLAEFERAFSRLVSGIEEWLQAERTLRQALASKVIGSCHSGLTQMQVIQAEQWATLYRLGERRFQQDREHVRRVRGGVAAAVWLRLAHERPSLLRPRELVQAAERRLESEGREVDRFRSRLAMHDPFGQLERGFAILKGSDGQWLTTVAKVQTERQVTAMLVDGSVELERRK